MSLDEVMVKLKKLGLSSYEAKAYIALIEGGPMTASELSTIASIPYSKIYGVLMKLKNRNLIAIERGRPSKYFARPPAEAIRELASNLREHLSEVEESLINELQPIYDRIYVQERPEVLILRGIAAVIKRIEDSIERARTEIELAIPLKLHPVIEKLIDKVLSASSRGVNVKLLIDYAAEELCELIGDKIEVRLREKMFGGGAIIDEREAIIMLELNGGNIIAIWSNHGQLVMLAKIYFNYLWRDAQRPAY